MRLKVLLIKILRSISNYASYIFYKIEHNKCMIYLFSLVSGVINGLFASGAGQILVFFLIYIKKMDTHKARATSLLCTCVATVVSLIRYLSIIKISVSNAIVVAISGLIFGAIGAKIMKKIESNILNMVSGFIIFGLSLYSIFAR